MVTHIVKTSTLDILFHLLHNAADLLKQHNFFTALRCRFLVRQKDSPDNS
ncbi:Uncharacterised protein [Vibrio cholerae]|nr:Uncharacterised protein [Vibrio cholerae]CSB19006.1 Uncharacterised protein [Vibrio cholerae]